MRRPSTLVAAPSGTTVTVPLTVEAATTPTPTPSDTGTPAPTPSDTGAPNPTPTASVSVSPSAYATAQGPLATTGSTDMWALGALAAALVLAGQAMLRRSSAPRD